MSQLKLCSTASVVYAFHQVSDGVTAIGLYVSGKTVYSLLLFCNTNVKVGKFSQSYQRIDCQ